MTAWDEQEDTGERTQETAVPSVSRSTPQPTALPGLLVTACPQPREVGRLVSLEKLPMVLGRGQAATVVLDDGGISREHARVERGEDERLVVVDLESKNGTYLNGRRVSRAVLADGDRLQLGYATAMRVSLVERPGAGEQSFRRAQAIRGLGTWEWEKASGELTTTEHVPGRLLGPGRTGWTAVLDADRPALAAALEAAFLAGEPCELQCRVLGPTGIERWVQLRGEVFNGDDGKPARLAGVLLDITAQKNSETQLEQMRHMFESLSEAIIAINREGTIVEWTGRAPQLFGYQREEMLGRDFTLLVGDVSSPLVDAIVAGVGRHGSYVSEQALQRRDGRDLLVQIRALPVVGDQKGGVILLVCSDVGAQRELERQLQLTERLTSLGTLAAGMAHEINNPLSFLMNNLEYLLEELGGKHVDATRALAECIEGAKRIATIVADLKALSRGSAPDEKRPVDVSESVAFAVRMTEKQIRYRAQLEVNLNQVPPVVANETRLGQVFFNLLMNAAQAIPEGAPEKNTVTVAVGFNAAGQQVMVEVRDTGRGIPRDLHARVFEPFFSTRRKSGGTGLGLSICHRIISDLGGDLVFESEEGKGTIFRVLLPATSSRSRVDTQPQLPPSSRRRSVLVVDDEPFILETLNRLLRKDFDVELVLDATEALERLRRGERYDVVLCDLMMPGMSGIDFHEALEREAPQLLSTVVFMTGGAFTERAHRFLDEVNPQVLSKPVQAESLRRILREAGDRTGVAHMPVRPTPH